MGMSVPGPKKNTRKVPIRYCSPIAVKQLEPTQLQLMSPPAAAALIIT